MKRLGIFGTGGFAREVGDIACELGYTPLYIARDKADSMATLPTDEVILESAIERYTNMFYAIGVGDNTVRQRLAQRFSGSIRFSNLIHPSATFGQNQRHAIENRQGIIVCAGVRFTNNIQLGDFCISNLNSTIGHDVAMGDFVNLAPGAHISGNVNIGSRCWIGTGAAINQGSADSKLNIGSGAVIGSGSVVVRDCEPNAVYVGIPAKRIK